MIAENYRLGDYKIIKSGTGELGWETHFGLGEITEGRCFIKGSILFIGPSEGRGDGFLKAEFMSHIKKFPNWLETKYYFKGFDIHHCQTGKRVTKFEMLLWNSWRGKDRKGQIFSAESDTHSDSRSSNKGLKPGCWRLQQYEITLEANNQICLKAYAGLNNLNVGTCNILEDILFLESRGSEKPKMNKRQFFEHLKNLPEWRQTAYYVPKFSLHEIQSEKEAQHGRKRWPGEIRGTEYRVRKKSYSAEPQFRLRLWALSIEGTAFLSKSAKKGLYHAAGWLIANMPIFFVYLGALWKKLRR